MKYGPYVLTAYTIYKYIAYIYEYCFKNYYQLRRPEEALIGEKYHKTIHLIKEDILKGYKLWKMLKYYTILELNSKI